MSEQSVIRLDSVCLQYRVREHRATSIKELAIQILKRTNRLKRVNALRDIDLEVGKAECLGIVGRNGAGKSTLLKVVSRILRPTTGTCEVQGRVAPILELGTGFDYELSGRENIELNGLLLGLKRQEILERAASMIDFSGLSEVIEQPIKSYSSGMVARLGFAIATAWVPDVLILDEVTAVGDARFKERCEGRIRELVELGTTTLVVSHDASTIAQLCSRCILLERGRLLSDGPPQQVLAAYDRGNRGPQRITDAADPLSREPVSTTA